MPKYDKQRQRLDTLFVEIDQLAKKADDSPVILRELEALRARVMHLETEFVENHKHPAAQENHSANNLSNNPQPHTAAPIRYEKEQITFVYSGDKMETLQDPGQVPPNANNAIATPLTAGGQTIGEVRIVPPPERPWTSDEINLTQAVARQVSLQVQNLRLLAATELARTEAEIATRRFTREGWESYLDAIHQSEHVGFSYDQNSVAPYEAKLPAGGGARQTLSVTGEKVGEIYLKTDRPLTNDDKEMLEATARQLSLQIENLRLLADAARARAEAEEATRLFTREHWKTFFNKKAEADLSFVYNSNQIIEMDPSFLAEQVALSQPLMVRGETVGHLAITGDQKKISPEQAGLMSAIAAQTSLHIETLRLAEELQQRALELQELDRLKSAFLANMSHELRTPLNSILGFADVMLEELDGPLTPNMDNDLRLIQKNGQHLLHLINDVLDMAKIESGKLNLIIEKFNLQEIIEEVTSITSSLASEKDIVLFVAPDSDHEVEISADRTRLRQVLINIVNNAMKFTEIGEISIHAAQEANNILISVKDTGIGIPPSQLESVFQEFTQVDSSTTRRAGGTGLGLPISRRLIELHGGRLWAESAGVEGEGATFYIHLPIIAKVKDSEPVTKSR